MEKIMQASYRPPRLITRWTRYFLGLTVGVAVGLSPYLGLVDVPLFRSLLELIPLTLQNTLIPLSSASMGIIAASVQWYAGGQISREYLNRLFIKSLMVCVVTFFALIIVHTMFVVTIPIKSGQESVSFLVGYSRPVVEPCGGNVSDEACIEILSFDSSEISSFWGDKQLRISRLLLFGTYLFFTCSFAAIIGLIVVRENLVNQSFLKRAAKPAAGSTRKKD